ncbi:hypothetical protein C2E21_7400 [Chlorella sorokiniana]|uniref:Activator of Hsp90 ATPase AHSA1-like N-terminal domain-containing protein n=1 Tax=Chlorella sorokiniana TaxID=3076 RepID=A0A2P6THM5_CHLSO|nr:hypothetical protein C2E21_7400 [Chlorella sorokiniana]|eukprot:PRW33793.1 hypothetical protein C2E21_7400 [Chlorella sorokiniana]
MEKSQSFDSKLQQQATAKAELSYSYWAANAAAGAPPPEPKKLTEEEAAAQQQQLQHTQSGASAWNAAGTFEEKSISLAWVQEQLGALLGELRHAHQGASVAVADVTSCSGEAHQWLVRGKKRAGFELSFEFKWACTLDGAQVTGTAKVPHAAADELDELSLEVTADKAATDGEGSEGPTAEQRRRGEEAARGLLPLLEPALEQLLERCRQK